MFSKTATTYSDVFVCEGINMFKLNDKVIYPGHGVALIDQIVEKQVAGKTVSFIKLVFLFKDMTILVPTYNLEGVGVRVPCSIEEIGAVMGEIGKKPERRLESIDFTPSGWNRRNKDYQSRIQSGKLIEIAKIYRDLMYVAQQKDLSFGERTLLQVTEELITQEIQIVKNIDREMVMQELRSPFKQFMFFDRTFNQDGKVQPQQS
jgi:CarD family transcriptional regulator